MIGTSYEDSPYTVAYNPYQENRPSVLLSLHYIDHTMTARNRHST